MKSYQFSAFLLLLLISKTTVASSQSLIVHTSSSYREVAKNHKLIAVLPFVVQLQERPEQVAKMGGIEVLAQEQERQAFQVQQAMINHFLLRKKKKGLSFNVQDFEHTNAVLRENKLSIDQLAWTTPQRLANLLGVDAIVSGLFGTVNPVSDGVGLALGAGMSAITGFGLYGLNSAHLRVFLHDGVTGQQLWQFDRDTSRGLNAGTNDLVLFMMRSSKTKFPYIDEGKR